MSDERKCDEKWILHNQNDQLSGWTEKKLQGTSQVKLTPKKVTVTGGLLPV